MSKPPLDLAAIQQARKNLDRIAREHPELVDHERAQWSEQEISEIASRQIQPQRSSLMPIQESDICVGGIYATENNQERRITMIDAGHVHYDSRGGNVQNDWAPGHTKSAPPTIAKFAADCSRVVKLPG